MSNPLKRVCVHFTLEEDGKLSSAKPYRIQFNPEIPTGGRVDGVFVLDDSNPIQIEQDELTNLQETFGTIMKGGGDLEKGGKSRKRRRRRRRRGKKTQHKR
jgi:hypothetical protein